VANLDVMAEEVSFWKPINRNIADTLKRLLGLTTVPAMERAKLFDGKLGFLQSNIVLRLNALGEEG
jgi:hypothetical protein